MTDAIHIPNSLDAPLVDAEFIANKHKDAFVAASDVLRAEADLPGEVHGEADLVRLQTHARAAMGAHKALDAARTGEKRRFDEAAKEVQGLFTPRLTKLDASKKVALDRITIHNRKVEEAERKRRAEAAQREQAEAARRAAAAAALEDAGHADVAATVMDSAVESERTAERLQATATGKASDLVRVQTSAGTVTSATSLTFEITDFPALRQGLGPLGDYLDQPSIEKAIRAYMKAAKLASREPSLNGVRFFSQSTARVR